MPSADNLNHTSDLSLCSALGFVSLLAFGSIAFAVIVFIWSPETMFAYG